MSILYSDKMMQDMHNKLIESIERDIERDISSISGSEIWCSQATREIVQAEEIERQMYDKWAQISVNARDPVQRLRDEIMDELSDMKKAVNKMGILLDSEKPTQEQLNNHKTLKDAYLKYKMVEKLILGNRKK